MFNKRFQDEAADSFSNGRKRRNKTMAKYGAMLLGGLLVVCGFISAWAGMEIVQIERGWTQVIAGVTALTGGVVTLAIGLLIGAVENLRENKGERRSYASRTGRLEIAAPAERPQPEAMSVPVATATAAVGVPLAPILQPAPQAAPFATAAKAPPSASVPEAPAASTAPIAEKNALTDTISARADAEEHDPALEWLRSAPRSAAGLNKSGMVMPGPKKNGPHAAAAPTASEKPDSAKERPAELRRYEANGVQYTLYADGSIESNSTEGLLHFANMDELKAHLSLDDAQQSAKAKAASDS